VCSQHSATALLVNVKQAMALQVTPPRRSSVNNTTSQVGAYQALPITHRRTHSLAHHRRVSDSAETIAGWQHALASLITFVSFASHTLDTFSFVIALV
jgi:hypothetical protein